MGKIAPKRYIVKPLFFINSSLSITTIWIKISASPSTLSTYVFIENLSSGEIHDLMYVCAWCFYFHFY
jgi:hypothetical protein